MQLLTGGQMDWVLKEHLREADYLRSKDGQKFISLEKLLNSGTFSE